MFDIEEELKKLPENPGVYIMRNKEDEIIYIGKAVVLKNRVRQYFQKNKNHTNKIKQMIHNIDHFEYIITDSELEALVLEANMIKEHQPRYNTLLKDDKGYPYIKITMSEVFPRVLLARSVKKDKNKYFGPYVSVGAINDTLELLNKAYKIRTCNRNLPKDIGKERACLNYHIGKCQAPCQGHVDREVYRQTIHQIIYFLNGNYEIMVKQLENKMIEAAENLEFEQAGEYKELIQKIKIISERQKIESHDMENRDIIAFATEADAGVVQIFFIRNGRLRGRENYHIEGVRDTSNSEIMTAFIKQFYAGTPFIPRELILQCAVDGQVLLEEWLTEKRGQKVYIKVPEKGDKKRLVELAMNNAALVLNRDGEKLKQEERRTIGALREVVSWLGLPDEVSRVEAYDISNISGVDSVGSMICFEKGKPKRSDYRKFKIKWVKGPDDYASMEEVLKRRFLHGMTEKENLKGKDMEVQYGSFTRYPDLIMMDGGKGQVNIALKVLKELGLSIPVCGMVKDDRHRTRGLYYRNQEIPIDTKTEGFKLITRIQDEAHRFAIEYHRKLRGKGQVKSILDEINGIGPTRRKALIRHFESIENIQEASVEQLLHVDGMNSKAAQAVFDFFRKQA